MGGRVTLTHPKPFLSLTPASVHTKHYLEVSYATCIRLSLEVDLAVFLCPKAAQVELRSGGVYAPVGW